MYNNTNIPEEDLKLEYIQIRVTSKEKKVIQQLAKLQHLSVSSLVRWLLLSKYYHDLLQDRS